MFASYSSLVPPPNTGYGPIVFDAIEDHIEPSDVIDDDEIELRQYELGRTIEPGLVRVVMRTNDERPANMPQPPPSPSPASPMMISPKMTPSRSRLISPTSRRSPIIANKPGTKSSTLMAISPKQNSVTKKTPTKSNRSPTSSAHMQSPNRQALSKVNPNVANTAHLRSPTKPKQHSTAYNHAKSINAPILGGSFYPLNIFNNIIRPPAPKPKSVGGFMTAEELEAEEQSARDLQKQLREVHEIAPKLYLSGRFPAQSKNILDSFGITHVLVAAGNEEPKFAKDFFYMKLDVADRLEENLLPHFDKSADHINGAIQGGGTVLVHCSAGASRSASIIAAYLIKYHKMSSESALELLKSKRSIVNPNPSFLTQLQHYHKLKQRERGELSLIDEVLSFGLMSVLGN